MVLGTRPRHGNRGENVLALYRCKNGYATFYINLDV